MPSDLASGTEFRLLCPICTDEVDAIGAKRYESQSGGEREIQRTMLELLNQMDGFDARGDVKARAPLEMAPPLPCPDLVATPAQPTGGAF